MLDLHNSEIKVISDSIGDLVLLRDLDLSQNMNIKKLPSSIGRLLNLQALRLNHCSNLKKLPGAIKKLVNLRNLENESCYSLTRMPRGLGELYDLKTLSEFVVSKGNGSVSKRIAKLDELQGLGNFTGKLKIKHLRGLGGDDTAMAHLEGMQYLVSLILIWDIATTIDAVDCKKLLEDLWPHQNLKELSLSAYRGVTFSSWLPEHKNLARFSLSRCTNCICLPPLHHLPHLEELLVDELPKLEYISDKTLEEESGVFFNSLKEIRLTNLPNLVWWWKHGAGAESPTFPSCLSKLIIKDCPNRFSMPLFPSLEGLLVLNNTRWEPFQQTIAGRQIPGTKSEASSSTRFTDHNLSKLKTLHIVNTPKGGPNMWQSLSSLCSLAFDHVQEI
ncbi:hypothetical protein TIFTF001_036097 [Ficus carica]|uniref:R13L1/DRL21-like LRR repeat region domain-containing protein n=1 Tax=Ficus carica TaxID=3494 RepID=A0AA88E3N4_FICCA|nr:hypothetical protein TIFTF001_036097 [Ficus carica]